MGLLYIVEQGAFLRKRGNRLVVEKLGVEIQSVLAFKIEQVILMGNIQVSTSAVAFLLKEGIDTVFLSIHGKYRGRLMAQFGKNIFLRQTQFKKLEDEKFALDIAKKYVEGKLSNCRTLLRRHNYELKDDRITEVLHRLRRIVEKVPLVENCEILRGMEGNGTREYFSGLKCALRNPELPFNGRNRRPPRDEINALMSFGYTILGNVVQTAVNIVGLDPYFGSLHSTHYGRPSLVLDLMEEFRPVLVDTLILRLVNKRIITKRDFYIQKDAEIPPEGVELEEVAPTEYPVLLTHEGMKKFIMQFEGRLQEKTFYPPLEKRFTFRDICLEQVRLLVRAMNGESVYEPYTIR